MIQASTEKLIILYFPFGAAGGITPKPNINMPTSRKTDGESKSQNIASLILARCLLSSGLTFHTASGNQGQEMDANAV